MLPRGEVWLDPPNSSQLRPFPSYLASETVSV